MYIDIKGKRTKPLKNTNVNKAIKIPNNRKLFDLPFFKLNSGNLENRTGLISKKLKIIIRNIAKRGSPIFPYD